MIFLKKIIKTGAAKAILSLFSRGVLERLLPKQTCQPFRLAQDLHELQED